MKLKTIIIKEISGILYSLRFQILLITTQSLFLISGVLYVDIVEKKNTDHNSLILKQLSEKEIATIHLNKFAGFTQFLLRNPGKGNIISINSEERLPDLIFFDAFYLGGDHAYSGIRHQIFSDVDYSNYKLTSYTHFDWIFISGIIMSFFILILTYDCFSGEKQMGTLSLLCSFPVARKTLFQAKYIANFIIILCVFILGIVINLITVLLLSGFQVTLPSLGQIAFVLLIQSVYFSVFILIGMWFSSKSILPATSLSYALFSWLLLVIFIPSAAQILGRKIHKIPSNYEHNENMLAAHSQIWENAPEKAGSYGPPSAFNGKVYPYMDLRKKVIDEMTDVVNQYTIQGFNDMYEQAAFSYRLGKISPYIIMQSICEKIAGNGLEDLKNDFDLVVEYRRQLRDFIESKDLQDPKSFHFVNAWHDETYSSAPVDIKEIPLIKDQNSDIVYAMKNSAPEIAILIVVNLIILIAGWRGFYKYDVR